MLRPVPPRELSDEDAVLVVRVSEGDVAAYRELVRRHAAKLTHYARRLLGDESEAEDVVQETCLRLWQRAADYSPEARVTTWLHRITHNLAVDRLRARGRFQPVSDDEVEAEPISAPQPRELETKHRVATLETAWAELPERQAAALALVHFDGLSGSEAAQVLGVSEEAVESLLARGRRALKAHLRAHDLVSGASQ
ncbi:MAG TPA: sigma-70 family RNA polymerase sigma factor [Polyangiaceae bacterium]|jgi:RNA polymerase sigma-70 factor (ECF subfamily)|nr:sigma-70 family RNA polymerase sigma factor [Polyangiaceae bacterium]